MIINYSKQRFAAGKIITAILFLTLLSCSDNDESIDIVSPNPDLTQVVTDDTTHLILKWNKLWVEMDRYASGMRPTATARSLAYIHLAAYETMAPDMVALKSCTGAINGLNVSAANRGGSIDMKLALNTSYAMVMNHFMYNISDVAVANKVALLEAELNERHAVGLSLGVIQESQDWGRYVAAQVIAYSLTDQQAASQINEPQPRSYVPPVAPGNWTFSHDNERALFPYWGSVRTFIVAPQAVSTVAPLTYSASPSSTYYQQMEETYTVSTTARVQDNNNLWIAEFWSDDVEGMMMSPPGRQISIANQLVEKFDMSAEQTLALYLKLGFSLNDAAVATWHYKYQYMVMRPNLYIQNHIDPSYQTNLYRFIDWPNPSFPSYPSGHSAFASAAAGLFIEEFGDNVFFIDRSHEGRIDFRGSPRPFNSFTDMAQENAFSRIPLGVHMRMDCEEGLRLGYEVSNAVSQIDLAR